MNWPAVEIDPVVGLRALAAALPHVALEEHVFDAPFEPRTISSAVSLF